MVCLLQRGELFIILLTCQFGVLPADLPAALLSSADLYDYITLDNGHLQSFLLQGAIDWTVSNMLTEGKADYDIDNLWSREKKSKEVKGWKVKVPLKDDSTPPKSIVDDSAFVISKRPLNMAQFYQKGSPFFIMSSSQPIQS